MTGAPATASIAAGSEETLDAFHRGNFHLVQPARHGHRSGIDAMLLAGAVPGGFSGRLADLGAGAGGAALAVLSRCPDAQATLVEKSPEMAAFARKSLAYADNAHLRPRGTVLEADVTLAGKTRATAGLADRAFDSVIMNPPFNAAADRATPYRLRHDAHVMPDELLEAWVRTACAILRPRGGFAAIIRPSALERLLAAMTGRFGAAQLIAVHPHVDKPAIRVVLRATRGARGALAMMPPLVLHDANCHALLPRAEAICNGRFSLFGD